MGLFARFSLFRDKEKQAAAGRRKNKLTRRGRAGCRFASFRIIWVILLVLPLFSELEFLGVKVKKEVKKAVEKSNEEVKASLDNLQQIVSQIQVSNSVAPQFTINSGSLPTEEKIDKLTEELHLFNEQNKNKQAEQQDYQHRADKSQFLADDRKYEIVVRFGNPQVFLSRLTESLTEEPARADRKE